MNLDIKIKEIGRQLVNCENNCEGISLNISKGILPRCLILEDVKDNEKLGAVIVGLNPGLSSKNEKEFYMSNGLSYESEVKYWIENISSYPYYTKLRSLLNELGFIGNKLWTELVKCENYSSNSGLPPLQTFRNCTELFLKKELNQVPDSWPIIAVGRESYKALAYMFPRKTIIGVPHPTGSFGQFAKLLADKSLLKEIKTKVEIILNNSRGEAIWLSVK